MPTGSFQKGLPDETDRLDEADRLLDLGFEKKIGEILISQGKITERDVERALVAQGEMGEMLGQVLVKLKTDGDAIPARDGIEQRDRVLDHLYSSNVRTSYPDVELIIGCGDLPFYYLDFLTSAIDVPINDH